MTHTDAILNIDGYKWTALKLSRRQRQDATRKYHELLRNVIVARHKGDVWLKLGDGAIASHFPRIQSAVNAALEIQRELTYLNEEMHSIVPLAPLSVRIGVAPGSLPSDVPEAQRSEYATAELNLAGHLQKHCPPGRVLISHEVFASMDCDRHAFRPGATIHSGSSQVRTFVSVDRSLTPLELEFRKELTEVQQRCYPLLAFPDWRSLAPPEGFDLTSVRDVLQDACIILGETRPPSESPVGATAATSDAACAIEIAAAVSAAATICTGIDEWADTETRAFNSNVVVIGAPQVNLYAHAMNAVMMLPSPHGPAGFVRESSGLMRLALSPREGEQFMFPQRVPHAGSSRETYGLVFLLRSPLNPEKLALWIAGINGVSTYAGGRFVHDLLVDPNSLREKREASCPDSSRPAIAVVTPRPDPGYQLRDYLGMGWRVSDYAVVWVNAFRE